MYFVVVTHVTKAGAFICTGPFLMNLYCTFSSLNLVSCKKYIAITISPITETSAYEPVLPKCMLINNTAIGTILTPAILIVICAIMESNRLFLAKPYISENKSKYNCIYSLNYVHMKYTKS